MHFQIVPANSHAYMDDMISILSQIRASLPLDTYRHRCSADTVESPARCAALSSNLSADLQSLFLLPQPLTSDLLALGLHPTAADYLSRIYIRAAARLKRRYQSAFNRATHAYIDIGLIHGADVPDSLPLVYSISSHRFIETLGLWAENGISLIKRRLLASSLTARAQISTYGRHLSTPCVSIGKKTKHCASPTTRRVIVSPPQGTLDQMTSEPTRVLVIKKDPGVGVKSTQDATIQGSKSKRFVDQNPCPTSWDLTSLIDDFHGLSIRDRSNRVSSKNEAAFGTYKIAPSERTFTLFKHPSSTINRPPSPARVESTAGSSHLRSSLQSSCDVHSQSASSLSTSKTIQSARRRKIAPCPNRDRWMQSHKRPDDFFSRQTHDATITSSPANAKRSSDQTSRCLSPSASTHTRRRKIATLPPRHSSTTITDIAVIISPDVRRFSQKPSLKPIGNRQSTIGTPGRFTGPTSRSPSLASLSSDESGLSCSGELETPPSSPTLPSTILTTTISEKFSVSPDEYGFLSAALHNISPAPHLLKAEISRPRTFIFSAKDEDYPRFPFSR
uniref:A2 mating type protein n=1 Tax=Heterobasidion occidentale TaxID=942053 RepID=S5RTQ9_9AGAM|nr:a2 mating type protein [Heterobasidion occidentale]